MDSPDLRTWVIVMTVQSIPYVSAVLVSIMSSLTLPASLIGLGYRDVDPDADEPVPAIAAVAPVAGADPP